MNTLVLVMIVLFILAWIVNLLPNPLLKQYEKKKYFLTVAERSFFNVLKKSVGNDYTIFAQVRVADVMMPKKQSSRKQWWKAFTKVACKHFDFVLCDPQNLKIIGVIELDDSSHERKDRIIRDRFLNIASEGAGLTLIRFPVRQTYSVKEIRERLKLLH